MDTKMPKSVEAIIESTIEAIESCKNDLLDISLATQQESDDIKIKLMEIKQEVIDVIDELEDLQKKEKLARIRLLNVSKNLRDYTEEHIRDAYEKANALQVQVRILKNKEKDLIAQRTELEYQLIKNKDKLAKAEKANMQIGIALEYLKIDLNNPEEKLDSPRENLGAKVIIAQEKERLRLAREIHDGPAQAMANIIIRAEYCERLFDKNIVEARQELKKLKEQIRTDLKDIRKIIYNLRPMTLDDLGLVPTLTRMIEELNARQTMTQVRLELHNMQDRLPSVYEVAVFRIIQEALNNIYKHAEATQAVVSLHRSDKLLTLSIADDGKGFDPEAAKACGEAEGFGLLGMTERVDLIGGEIQIASETDKGTKIKVEFAIAGGRQ